MGNKEKKKRKKASVLPSKEDKCVAQSRKEKRRFASRGLSYKSLFFFFLALSLLKSLL